MSCALLDLPVDVLRSIWRYLTLPEIVRFGATTKNMTDITWNFVQDVTTDTEGTWPVKSLLFILSRDLSQLRSLGFYYSPYEYQVPKEVVLKESENIRDLTQNISSLKLATNLQNFSIDIYIPEYDELDPEYQYVHTTIFGLVSSLTQLHRLSWVQNTDPAEDTDEVLNVDQYFRAHTRLSSLSIKASRKMVGLGLLTQLKHLEIRQSDAQDAETFSSAMTLPQLTSFCVNHHGSFPNMENLRNLETLECCGFTVDLTALQNLPKLANFCLYPSFEQDLSTAIPLIGQLSNLTALKISCWQQNDDLVLGRLTRLTNLSNLIIGLEIKEADFSGFKKLTGLELHPNKAFRMSNLPPNLDELLTSSFALSEENIKEICYLNNLTQLQLSHHPTESYNPIFWRRWISRLTKLTFLTIFGKISTEFVLELQRLPNLANLTLNELPTNMLDAVAKLTQLIELQYMGRYNKDAKHKLPFRCTFIGDPYASSFEYRSDWGN